MTWQHGHWRTKVIHEADKLEHFFESWVEEVLDFPQSTTQKEMLQFIGLANFFRDHVPHMTEMVKPLRDMIPHGRYQRIGKFIWTTESSAAFKLCQQAIADPAEPERVDFRWVGGSEHPLSVRSITEAYTLTVGWVLMLGDVTAYDQDRNTEWT